MRVAEVGVPTVESLFLASVVVVPVGLVAVRVAEELVAPAALRLAVVGLVAELVLKGGFRAAAVVELAVLNVRVLPGLDIIELARREGVVFFSSSLALTLGRLR